MQNKYKLPEDTKTACISYVRGYKRLVYEYHKKRDDIIYSGKNISFDRIPGGGTLSDEPYDKMVRLQEIEGHFDTKIMRAVEQAILHIGVDVLDEGERQRLKEAIIDCCKDGRRFVFRYCGLDMGKSTFYERRNKFLYEISKYLQNSYESGLCAE